MTGQLSARAWPALGTLRVTGPDRNSWLNGLLTCDTTGVALGRGAWGLALSRTGKVQSDVWVLGDDEQMLVAVSAGTHEALHAELDRMLIMEEAELTDVSDQFEWFAFHGKGASAHAAQVAVQHQGLSGTLDWTQFDGAALVLPSAQAKASAASIGESLQWLSDNEWTRFRLEHALPEFGVDYSNADRPHEVGIERRAISWSKGCYLGQEVVCMQDMRGKVKRSLRILRFTAEGDQVPRVGQAVLAAGSEAGVLTSVSQSRSSSEWLCMARILLTQLNESLTLDGSPGKVSVASTQPVASVHA